MGTLAFDPAPMALETAAELLKRNSRKYFDYLMGRVMKIDLENPDEFDSRLYDRDLGQGAAQRAIDTLRA